MAERESGSDGSSDILTVIGIEFIEVDNDIDVYDIEVGIDESFICSGAVLHNSAICRARDGMTWPIDKPHPSPPAHWNCRSSLLPLTKSWRELGIDIDEAPEGTRASMNGQIPESVKYPEWLKGQPREFVEEVLGKDKAKLFLDGDLSIDKFVTRSGQELTLAQLREREPEAFRRAGL